MDYELKDIQKDIIDANASIPVVLDFWADWCGPCKTLGPILEKLASKANGKWKFVKVDLEKEENQPLASQFQIRSIPAVRMIYKGKMLGYFDGALPEHAVKEWLDKHLPDEFKASATDDEDDIDALILKLISEGKREEALEFAKKAYQADMESDEQKVRLAMLLLPGDDETALKLMQTLKAEGKYEIEKEAVLTIQSLKKEDALDDNSKAAELYEAGKNKLLVGSFDEAADLLVQSMMLSRSVGDDAARKVCVALFKLLGEKHPVTVKYRRRFSMALY